MKTKSLFLRFLMTLLAFACTLAGWAQTDYGIQIDGVSVTSANYQDITFDNGFDAISDGTVTYDPVSNTLTLTDVLIDAWSAAALSISGSVNVVLQGESNINIMDEPGIFVNGNCSISGSGTLRIMAESCAIKIAPNKTLTISDCTVYASGSMGYGITGEEGTLSASLVVDHATVHATGGTDMNGNPCGSICNLAALTLIESEITTPGVSFYTAYGAVCSDTNPHYGAVTTEVVISPSNEAYAYIDNSNDTTLVFYFDRLRSTRTNGTTYGVSDTWFGNPGWYANRENITSVVFHSSFASARPTSTKNWFNGMSHLSDITDIAYLNTSEVTTMSRMFSSCDSLTSLDVSHFNTAKVTDMSYMFSGCSSLTSLDVSHFSTQNVTTMYYMFSNCSSLTSLDVSNFNTQNVTNMGAMFEACQSLTNLDVSHFNTQNVTSMWFMFYDCRRLTSLDVSHFNTQNVINMNSMFEYCSSLTSLDVTNFNTANVTSMRYMFHGCSSLTTIYCYNDWNTANLTSSDGMFGSCSNLIGGFGTKYKSTNVDATYAHPDATGNPGYFTADEAYAYIDNSDTTTLVFYCDRLRRTRTNGTTYSLNDSWSYPGWRNNRASITSVVFHSSFADARPKCTYSWFSEMVNLSNITDIGYLNTSEVTDMSSMFDNCQRLTSLDVSHFNTAKVTDMSDMFYNCLSLTSLDVSNFNTEKVTDMSRMFCLCSGLTSLDVSNFNTAKVTDMRRMFNYCVSLTNLDLSNFNTANVKKMDGMFKNCENLTTIYCYDDWNTATLTSSADMFTGCTLLVGGSGTSYSSSKVDATYAHVDSGRNPGYFTDAVLETYAYIDNLADSTLVFYCDRIRSTRTGGTTYGVSDTWYGNPDWYANRENITSVVFDSSFAHARPTSTYRWFNGMSHLSNITGIGRLNTSEVTTMSSMFYDCDSLTSLDLSNFNTAKVTDMQCMFYNCSGLTSLDLSNFNTEKVTNMSYMFYNCSGLTSLDLSNFNTEKVTDISRMFSLCSGLTSLDLSNFNTAKVTDMGYMFYRCSGLTSLDVSNFNTANVTNMHYMFSNCSSLTSLDVSHFNTAKVTHIINMFQDCQNLTSLDVSHFNTAKVTELTCMFLRCTNLKTIYCNDDWNTATLSRSLNMFKECTQLVGGNGMTYDATKVDATYAHPDEAGNPGYFTKPPVVLGDVDNNGRITYADVTALVDILLGKDTTFQYNHDAADMNQSGTVTIADLTALVNMIQ